MSLRTLRTFLSGNFLKVTKKLLQIDCRTMSVVHLNEIPPWNLSLEDIIHCVGPVGEKPDLLQSTYQRALELCTENEVQTIAFPCISTGVYGRQAQAKYPASSLGLRVSLWSGDITKLQLDAIANAANARLAGGGGVDGAIHRAAGPDLSRACLALKGCPTGSAKITRGFQLPAKCE
ncbi:hypothetical protein AHF37_08377 [Paragonimus kellicotti]|nr:hypothetical protein AHF37_08377 [Paragonimus kellicotti]